MHFWQLGQILVDLKVMMRCLYMLALKICHVVEIISDANKSEFLDSAIITKIAFTDGIP